MEDHMLISARQAADAFGVSPVTIRSWHAEKKMTGVKPLNANRIGRYFTVATIRRRASQIEDDGFTVDRVERWLAEHAKEVTAQQTGPYIRGVALQCAV